MADGKIFDVIIIGGSYSGLSAAMVLGRSLRDVLIIDSELPCNRQTPHSHNFLTQDGRTPTEISSLAKQQVDRYETVQFHAGFACGDNSSMMRSVANAVSTGNITGAMVNKELTDERF